MAKKRDYDKDTLELVDDAAAEEAAAPEPTPAPQPSAPVGPLMTFDRWFAATGRPVHHKAGLAVFMKKYGGGGRRTKSAWDAFFAKY